MLDQKGQFYLNTDNNLTSGFQVPFWKLSGTEFMLENGVLYQYTGKNGVIWSWKEIARLKGTSNFTQSSSSIEVSIPLSLLKMTRKTPISIGFVWNDSKVDLLPVDTQMVKF
jgi:hypothetical protein